MDGFVIFVLLAFAGWGLCDVAIKLWRKYEATHPKNLGTLHLNENAPRPEPLLERPTGGGDIPPPGFVVGVDVARPDKFVIHEAGLTHTGPAEEWFCRCPSFYDLGPAGRKLNGPQVILCGECKMAAPWIEVAR